MAKPVKQLTDTQIKNAKVKEKSYKLTDGGGLYLLISPAGGKHWKLRYKHNSKEQTISLGSYPHIPLTKARLLREEYKVKIANGIQPNEEKRQKKLEKKIEEVKEHSTFKKLALERLTKEQPNISESHYKRTLRGFENDVFPNIGEKHIDDITAQDIIQLLKQMLARGVQNSASKVYQSISKTFKWAVANGFAKRNPAADIDAKEIIGTIKVNNYPTITSDEGIRNLLHKLQNYQGELSTKNGLLFLAYTFVRPNNINEAEWSEIDFTNKQWSIPASKMKMKSDHIIPLTESAIALLLEMKKYSHGKYIFPNAKSANTPMSDGTMRMALRRVGISKEEFTPHGFRAMFSTIAHEKSSFSHEVIETQLAHSVGNSVSQAYNRAKYLNERKVLMQWWSDYLDALKV